MSEAPATQQGGVNAAWVSVSSLNPAIRTTVANLEVGAVSEVLVEPRGFHLVRVEEKQEDATAGTQVKIADLFTPLTASNATLTEVANRARSFREDVGGGDLTKAAQEYGIAVRETQPFMEEGMIPGLGLAPELQEFAFTSEVGTVSAPIDRTDSWLVARVKERRDLRVPAFAEVEARVRNEVADLERRQKAGAEAETFLPRLRAGETMEAIAASNPAIQHKMIEGLARIGTRDFGSDPEVIGPIFAHEPGLIPQPLTGRTGAYLVRVLEKKPADRALFDSQKAQLRQSEVQQRQNQLFATWIEELRDEAEVMDFRAGMF
jgi:peptidyl-prolyl cis-trans isomerase D